MKKIIYAISLTFLIACPLIVKTKEAKAIEAVGGLSVHPRLLQKALNDLQDEHTQILLELKKLNAKILKMQSAKCK